MVSLLTPFRFDQIVNSASKSVLRLLHLCHSHRQKLSVYEKCLTFLHLDFADHVKHRWSFADCGNVIAKRKKFYVHQLLIYGEPKHLIMGH